MVTHSFNTYCWAGWWETETLNFCSSENIFILPPVLKKNISGYKILGWCLIVFFSPQQFEFYSIFFFSLTWFLRSLMWFLSLFIGKLFLLLWLFVRIFLFYLFFFRIFLFLTFDFSAVWKLFLQVWLFWHLSFLTFSELTGFVVWCLTWVWESSELLLFQIFLFLV